MFFAARVKHLAKNVSIIGESKKLLFNTAYANKQAIS